MLVVVGVALVSGRFPPSSQFSPQPPVLGLQVRQGLTVGAPRMSSPSLRVSQASLSLLTRDRTLDSCGQLMKAYMSSLLTGNQHEVAQEAAAAVYEENYNAG